MHIFYFIGLEKWYKPMIWLDKKQNHLLYGQNDVVMYFVERVNQGESLASWLDWLTEPPAVCWSVIMGDLSASWKGVYWTLPKAFRTGLPSCAVHSMRLIISTQPENRLYMSVSVILPISGPFYKHDLTLMNQLG